MAITKFTHQKDDSFDDSQRLMCSVPGCPNRWSVHSDGEKPKCSKHQWEKTLKPPAVKSWHDVGEVF
jgi:hypothetical protein